MRQNGTYQAMNILCHVISKLSTLNIGFQYFIVKAEL